jgi:hypothetical protein
VKPPREFIQDLAINRRSRSDPYASRFANCERSSCRHEGRTAPADAAPARTCCAKSAAAKKPKIDWTIGIRARGCRGLSIDWVVFQAPIAPPPAQVAWRPADAAVAVICPRSFPAPEVSYAPPTPPA